MVSNKGGIYHPISFEPRKGVFGRGMAEFWQAVEIAPEITWYPDYRSVQLYVRPCNYNINPVGRPRGSRSYIRYIPRAMFKWITGR